MMREKTRVSDAGPEENLQRRSNENGLGTTFWGFMIGEICYRGPATGCHSCGRTGERGGVSVSIASRRSGVSPLRAEHSARPSVGGGTR